MFCQGVVSGALEEAAVAEETTWVFDLCCLTEPVPVCHWDLHIRLSLLTNSQESSQTCSLRNLKSTSCDIDYAIQVNPRKGLWSWRSPLKKSKGGKQRSVMSLPSNLPEGANVYRRPLESVRALHFRGEPLALTVLSFR